MMSPGPYHVSDAGVHPWSAGGAGGGGGVGGGGCGDWGAGVVGSGSVKPGDAPEVTESVDTTEPRDTDDFK